MAEFSPSIVPAVVQACQQGADEASAALTRTLDVGVKLAVGEPQSVAMAKVHEELAGPGLVIVLTVGGAGALVLLPNSSGLIPAWAAEPDATGKAKLTTLAQELGMLLLPEEFMPEDFAASCVGNLSQALMAGEAAADAAIVPLELHKDGSAKVMYLVWPAAKPGAVVAGGGAPPKPQAEPAKPAPAKPAAAAPRPAPAKPAVAASKPASAAKQPRLTFERLPLYVRSLMRIRVPVVVTLAQKRQRLSRIMELGPGSIIQFDKSCEEMLELDVGGRRVASGEAVKVGDKFGLRISAIILPEERFAPVRKDGKQTMVGKRVTP